VKTILLIEDNEDILQNLTEYFELKGYKVIGARNGRKGVDLATESTPDLVICDVLMPVMDGYQVLDALLQSKKTEKIPFIFSTSMSEKANREEALTLGADDFIVKPFELESLLRMAEFWLGSGSLKRKNFRNQTGSKLATRL